MVKKKQTMKMKSRLSAVQKRKKNGGKKPDKTPNSQVIESVDATKYRKATLDYIGERIVEIRKARRIKQRYLAQLLGITEAHLRNMEKGNIYPRLPILIRIINEFDINPNYLFLEHETKKTRYLVNA
ncbi:MAG: helix-turn-helix transcriptional regulator [Chitinivibrionales bacterium]|nr:helix-turn-helix transcriptional regulator [Chitinivibrionales bacterium]